MVWNRKKRDPHDLDFQNDAFAAQTDSGSATEQSAAASTERPVDVANPPGPEVAASPAPSSVSAPLDATGTPNADVFLVHTGTLAAAAAQPPTIAQFSSYSAAQGDVIDFAAIRSVSYVPPVPDSTQVRVVEDTGGEFATFEFNFGTAGNPVWTALAKLDGVHLGDPVNVALDATHTVQLHSAWLA